MKYVLYQSTDSKSKILLFNLVEYAKKKVQKDMQKGDDVIGLILLQTKLNKSSTGEFSTCQRNR